MDPDLALFAHVVEAGSMSAAARGLRLSVSIVSKRIARLETRLGVRLLERSTRKLEPTARGRLLFEDVTEIIACINRAEARVADRTLDPSGPLRVTAPTSFGRLHLAPVVQCFLNRYPDVELDLELSDGFIDIARSHFDMAIRITSAIAPNLTAHRIAGNERVLCASPEYLSQYGVPSEISELADHKLLAADGQMPWQLTGDEGDLRVSGESFMRTNSSEIVRELCLVGAGIALRSVWDVSEHLVSGRLVQILPTVRESAHTGIFAIHRRTGATSGVRAMLTLLLEMWSPYPPWENSKRLVAK